MYNANYPVCELINAAGNSETVKYPNRILILVIILIYCKKNGYYYSPCEIIS
jgi:hypothetical protein